MAEGKGGATLAKLGPGNQKMIGTQPKRSAKVLLYGKA